MIIFFLISCKNSEKTETKNNSESENGITQSEFKKLETNNYLELEYKILDKNDEQIEFSRLHKIAEYPGGFDSLAIFIQRNFKFSNSSDNEDIKGRVETTFSIDIKGNVIEVELIKGFRKNIDKACLKVISQMPKWKPAEMRNGEKVKMKFLLPIKFIMEK